jgi:hypothetical protein
MPLGPFWFPGLWRGPGVLTFSGRCAVPAPWLFMSVKVFISQGAVDTWVSSDQAELSGSQLSFKGRPGTLELLPASLFKRISAGNTDPHTLVGKVLDEEAILALGGETYMSSVLMGEIAYDIEPGFIGVPAAGTNAWTAVEALRALDT